MFDLTLPYPPTMNTYWRHIAIGGKPRTLISEDGRKYKAAVGLICKTSRLKPLAGDVGVIIAAYRPRAIGDIDNLLKPILDALKGSAFADDNQVVQLIAVRKDDKANPRVEVKIWGAEE